MYAKKNEVLGSPLFSWSLDGAFVSDMEDHYSRQYETYDGIPSMAQYMGRLASDQAWAKKQKEKPNSFVGDYAFLSNMYLLADHPIEINGMCFYSVENAYQAMKCRTLREMEQFQFITPYEAKELGKKVQLRSNWDRDKIKIMRKLLRLKFQDPDLAIKLLETEDMFLCHKNWWGDTYWGKCYEKIEHLVVDGEEVDCPQYIMALESDEPHVTAYWTERKWVGENHLGKLLCEVREEIRKSGVYKDYLQQYIMRCGYQDWMVGLDIE